MTARVLSVIGHLHTALTSTAVGLSGCEPGCSGHSGHVGDRPSDLGVHFGGVTQILNPLPVWTVEVAA